MERVAESQEASRQEQDRRGQGQVAPRGSCPREGTGGPSRRSHWYTSARPRPPTSEKQASLARAVRKRTPRSKEQPQGRSNQRRRHQFSHVWTTTTMTPSLHCCPGRTPAQMPPAQIQLLPPSLASRAATPATSRFGNAFSMASGTSESLYRYNPLSLLVPLSHSLLP